MATKTAKRPKLAFRKLTREPEPEQAEERPKLNVIESFRGTYLAIGSQNEPLAILTLGEAADEADLAAAAQSKVPDFVDLKHLVDVAYDEFYSVKTQQWLESRKKSGIHYGNETLWCSNFGKRYAWLPRHRAYASAAKRRAYAEKRKAEELAAKLAAHNYADEHNRRVVDKELQQLLKEQEELEKRIYQVRERIRLQGPRR